MPGVLRTAAPRPLLAAVLFTAALLAAALLVGTLPLVRPASLGADLDRFDAGERATERRAVSAEVAGPLVGRARALWRAIGLAAIGEPEVALVVDRFHGRSFHELTAHDAQGRPIALLRLEPATGALVSAVRLDFRERLLSGSTDAAAATAVARRTLAALGVRQPEGAPAARAAMNGALWVVSWPRVVGGVPVDRDGTTVRIWRSGGFHSLTVSERPLAAMARRLSVEEARRRLEALLPGLLASGALADARLERLDLRWVAPNDTFAAERADAPGMVLRLAWVAEFRFTGETGERVRALAAWIDAEDGSLLGGDVIR